MKKSKDCNFPKNTPKLKDPVTAVVLRVSTRKRVCTFFLIFHNSLSCLSIESKITKKFIFSRHPK